jgi:predicted phosphodiesterase
MANSMAKEHYCKGTAMIGIMADSHGQAETIAAALGGLKSIDCRCIYHLGDVCDSTHPETAEACLGPLRDLRVTIIKGNNDQAIVTNHSGREKPPVSAEVLQYLKNLPLIRYHLNAIFAHSLPFVREMGLSSMIGDMGCREMLRFFRKFPDHVFFRGHSHSPEVAWLQRQQIASQSLAVGDKFNLTEKFPCVVTCGALTRGFYMVWNPSENVIECHSFR